MRDFWPFFVIFSHFLCIFVVLDATRIVPIECIAHVSCFQSRLRSLPYNWKYWWESNLAVEPKIAIARILADLNLAIGTGSPYVYMQVGNFGGF